MSRYSYHSDHPTSNLYRTLERIQFLQRQSTQLSFHNSVSRILLLSIHPKSQNEMTIIMVITVTMSLHLYNWQIVVHHSHHHLPVLSFKIQFCLLIIFNSISCLYPKLLIYRDEVRKKLVYLIDCWIHE